MWRRFFGGKTQDTSLESKSVTSSPYRSSSKEKTAIKPTRQRKTETSAFSYILLCAINFAMMGASGDYFSSKVPADQISWTGVGIGVGFFIIGVYFLFRGWVRAYYTAIPKGRW